MDIEVGSFVLIDGETYEVLGFDPNGYVQVRLGKTLERVWVDFYLVELIDPNRDEISLLRALGSLSDGEQEDEEVETEGIEAAEDREPPAFLCR